MADETSELVVNIKTVFDDQGFKDALDDLDRETRHCIKSTRKEYETMRGEMDKLRGVGTRTFDEVNEKMRDCLETAREGRKQLADARDRLIASEREAISLAGEFNRKTSEYNKENKKTAEEFKKIWNETIKDFSKKSSKALGDFFNFTKDSFLEIGNLADKIFNAILDSFFDVVGKMASTAIAEPIFGGIGGVLGGVFGGVVDFVGDLFGFRFGGTIPKTGPYMLHAGEYILPAEVVDAIRSSQRPPLTAAAGGLNIGQNLSNLTLKQTINIQTPANQRNLNIKELALELKRASKEGLSWAVDLAKVNYKIGKTGEGQIAL